jgi:hypothetical protein
MARNELEYVFRDLGTIEIIAGPVTIDTLTGRCDDYLFRPTLQLDGAFAGATIDVLISTEKSINPLTAEPNGAFVVFSGAPIAADAIVELPVCFGVRVFASAVAGGTNVRILLGGHARTTHPDGIMQGPG